MSIKIGESQAISTATRFLEQYHSGVIDRSAINENGVWAVEVSVGLTNNKMKKVMVDANTGRILGYSDVSSNKEADPIGTGLVMTTIEKVLQEIGKSTYETVTHKLYQDYRCYLSDCYDYPEYLNNVLKGLFGENYRGIVDNIKINLKEFSDQKKIIRFLTILSR
jgi:hypothetical protein